MHKEKKHSKKETQELLDKLNTAIDSTDKDMKLGKRINGIVILRFHEDGKSLTALGKICPHCINEIAQFLMKDKILSHAAVITLPMSAAGDLEKLLKDLSEKSMKNEKERRYVS